MAEARSSMSLEDRMSGPLQKILKAMDSTLKVMEQMDSATQQLDQKTMANARRSIDNAASGLARMQAQMKQTNDATSKAAQQQEKMNDALQRMKPPTVLERMRSLYQGMQREMAQATTAQQKFATALNMLRPSNMLERLKTVMKQHGDSADHASRQQENFNRSVESGIPNVKSLATGILGAIGAYQLFSMAKDAAKDLFSRGIEFHAFRESASVAFTTFLGDAEKAQQYMDNMYAFALKTPFAYPDLLASSRNLIAFGMSAENTFPVMQAIGDAVAAIGGGNAEMMNMADIFGQIQAQGRITATEVNRLSQYGINAFEILGNAAGKSADEMRKEISKGTVDAGTAIGALVEGIDKKFGGMMEGQKKSWAGLMDSLNSARRNAGAALTKDLMEPLADSVQNIINLFKKLPQYIGPAVSAFIPLLNKINEAFAEGRFDGIFDSLAAGLTFVAETLAWIGETGLWVAEIFMDNWSWIAPILFTMSAVLGTIAAILLFKYSILGLIRVATLAWAAAQWVVNAAYLANPIVLVLLLIVAHIALVIYALYAWGEQTAAVVGWIVGWFFFFGQVFVNIMIAVLNFGISVVEMLANAWMQGVYMIQMAWFMLGTMVNVILSAIVNFALSAAAAVVNTWNDGLYAVQMAFHTMAQAGLSIMSGLSSGVVGVVNAALGAVTALINTAVSGLNALISMANKVPGVNIGAIGTVDFKVSNGVGKALGAVGAALPAPTRKAAFSPGKYSAGVFSGTMPTAPPSVSFGKQGYGSPIGAMANGMAMGSNAIKNVSGKLTGVIDKVSGLIPNGKDFGAGMLNPGDVPAGAYDPTNGGASAPGGGGKAPGSGGGKGKKPGAGKKAPGGGKKAPGGGKKGKNPTGGKLDKVGKIEDDINIADEDLKMLKDLAERKAVKNFITLNPSVNFKDTVIEKDADVNVIIDKIDKHLREEAARSVEGVFDQ
ncbi:tape measure protein [Sporosarcina trichiuri]|uniref:tape measure protein n=1 Tax=Sporosarcina trichiuri TaxID=3056445 RepID=UPI0025B35188|nr:tape measure protein [Sporosarcina sp. 0.2-SM1T-5]WJY27480.1 tape measure protein [Sporosarcina sp. 0.2-SM1T-5]